MYACMYVRTYVYTFVTRCVMGVAKRYGIPLRAIHVPGLGRVIAGIRVCTLCAHVLSVSRQAQCVA